MTRLRLFAALLTCAVTLMAGSAAAQDLFELEVFEFGGVEPGTFEIALHTNAMSAGTTPAESIAANHRPAHLSVEITRGLTERVEAAVFLQTAPFGPSGSTRFAGGHVRGKVRLGQLRAVPLAVAISAEYTFNRAALDHELQTLGVRSILQVDRGSLSLVLNPSLEVVTRGADDGLEPVFDLSARGIWRLRDRVALTADYFSAAATVRHLREDPGAHHLVFGGVDVEIGSGWELGTSAGHCLTSSEPWVVKSVLAYSF